MSTPKTPAGLKAAGKKLWTTTLEEFELTAVELSTLSDACRLRDHIVALDAAVAKDGLMITSSQGMRLHPAVAEGRQSRLALARLIATLDLPAEDDLPSNVRPLRGVYTGRSARRGTA